MFTGPLAKRLTEVINETFHEALVPGANVDMQSLCQDTIATLNLEIFWKQIEELKEACARTFCFRCVVAFLQYSGGRFL